MFYIIEIMRRLLLVFLLLLFTAGCSKDQPKLKVVMGLGENEWQVMRNEIFPAFEKDYGIKVEAVQLESVDLSQILNAQISAGRSDIDLFAQDNMQLSNIIERGLAEDLSSYERGIPSSIARPLIEACKFQGRLYFMPYRPNVQITYYNRDKLKEYDLKPPRNWDELLNAAKIFKENEGVGKVLFKASGGAPTATQLYEWIVSAGGDPLSLNDPGCVRTYSFLQELWPYVSPDSIRAKFDTSNEYMARDSAYIMQNWPFGIRIIIEEYGKKEISTYHGFSGPAREAHVVGGEVLGIPKGSKNKEAALKLIKYLQSLPVQQKLVSRLGWPSIRNDAYGTLPEWMKPHYAAVSRALEKGVFRKNISYWNDLSRCMNEAFIEIVIRGAPVKPTLDSYRKKLDKEIRKREE